MIVRIRQPGRNDDASRRVAPEKAPDPLRPPRLSDVRASHDRLRSPCLRYHFHKDLSGFRRASYLP